MNRLQRDCFFFAATAVLLAGCSAPAVITEPDTKIKKTIKANGSGGIVEKNKNLQLVKSTDGFHTIGGPQAQEILGAIDPSPTPSPSTLKRVGPSPRQRMYHIKYNNAILASLSPKPPSQISVAPANSNAGYLRYRIWIPTDESDNIGQWSAWTTSNDPKGPDVDSSPSLSGTLLEKGKWNLATPSPSPAPDKTITIHATVNNTPYTWTGTWKKENKDGSTDLTGRGSIKWSCNGCP